MVIFVFLCIVLLQAGQFDTCLQCLAHLQELNKDDYKISLNKAVVEFYKNGQTLTDTLRQTLNLLRNQVSTQRNIICDFSHTLGY